MVPNLSDSTSLRIVQLNVITYLGGQLREKVGNLYII